MRRAAVNHDSRSELRAALDASGVAPKRRFGQNFLIDRSQRQRIVELIAAELPAGTPLWEIGPGLGALTALLVARGYAPTLFEIDHGLIAHLKREFGSRVTIVAGDAVRTIEAVDRTVAPVICGNLPYRSAAKIIVRIVESKIAAPRAVFLVQRELADRIAASPGAKTYAALTVAVQLRYEVERCCDVPARAFYPVPEVESTVVVLRRRRDLPSRSAIDAATAVARRAFAQRRKQVRNTLPDLHRALIAVGVPLDARPERIAIDRFAALGAHLAAAHSAS